MVEKDPETIRRLKNLGPGEEFTYYKGVDIDREYNSCNARASASDEGAPGYKRLLGDIIALTHQLKKEKKIQLEIKKVPTVVRNSKTGIEIEIEILHYIAIGQ